MSGGGAGATALLWLFGSPGGGVRSIPCSVITRRREGCSGAGEDRRLRIPDIFQLVSSQGKDGSLAISGNGRGDDFLFSGEDRRRPARPPGIEIPPRHDAPDAAIPDGLGAQAGPLFAVAGREEDRRTPVERGKISKEVLARTSSSGQECLFDVLTLREGSTGSRGLSCMPRRGRGTDSCGCPPHGGDAIPR